jgi:hypothetical protein
MDAAALAHALRATRSGRQWKCRCVAHEDASPSMIIFDGREQVQVRCLAGCDQRDLVAELKRRGLWQTRPDNTPCARQHVEVVSHETRTRDLARRLFDNSLLCVGTIAQRYLEAREIWSVAREIEDIRFHPRCPREKSEQPAIVVAMRDVRSRSIQAVQRIYLTRDCTKDGAMMLGPVGGAAMMLDPLGKSRELHIAEGLESALSVMAMDHWPTWAMGSCGAIERLAPIDGIDQLVIWADNDPPGIRAADICGERWAVADRHVRIKQAKASGQDAADVWRIRCARG